MTEPTPKASATPKGAGTVPGVYDRRNLTYSGTFDNPLKRGVIKSIEWCTGKIQILHMIREYEKRGKQEGQSFWCGVLDVMGIDLVTPQNQLDRIPKTGPVVVVANHPHGLVDGMVMAELVGRARED